MGLLLLVGGLSLLALPGVTRRFGRRLAPAEWARMCAGALAAGAAVVELSVVLYAAPTVLRAAGVHALAEACERVLGPLVPGGALAGLTAAAAAVAIPSLVLAAAGRARRRTLQCWMEPCVGSHSEYAGHDLVELPTESLLAVSVPVPTSQIIVSTGLAHALSAQEFRAVVEHERAHLDLGHHRFLVLASALEQGLRFLPLRASARATRAAVERWADEAAAGSCDQTRQALRSALLRVTATAVGSGATPFSTAESVVERLDALDDSPCQPGRIPRALLYAPGFALGIALTLVLGASAGSAQALLAVTGHCPL